MLNDASMRNNGDGTVTFEFQMDADDITEIAVLKKMMSDYNECVNVLRKYFITSLHTCEVCGKPASITHTMFAQNGAMTGPFYYCEKCAKGVGLRQ